MTGVFHSTDPARFWSESAAIIARNCASRLTDIIVALCLIPISSADSERAHSKYRYLLTHRRHGISFAKIRLQALLYTNGRSYDLPKKYLNENPKIKQN